jgi:hypothetical protein
MAYKLAHRPMEQNEGPRNKSMYPQTTDSQQRGQKYTWRKESLFSKLCWENWIPTCRRLKFNPYLSPCIWLKSKWINDLNVKIWTSEAATEKHKKNTLRYWCRQWFPELDSKAQEIKTKNWQMELYQIKKVELLG